MIMSSYVCISLFLCNSFSRPFPSRADGIAEVMQWSVVRWWSLPIVRAKTVPMCVTMCVTLKGNTVRSRACTKVCARRRCVCVCVCVCTCVCVRAVCVCGINALDGQNFLPCRAALQTRLPPSAPGTAISNAAHTCMDF